MESLRVIPDLTKTGFRDGEYSVTPYTGSVVIGGMPKGTKAGKPVVMIAIENPETGGFTVIETTLALFLTTADGLKVKYGDPRE